MSGLDFDNSEPKPWKKNSYACVFLFVLYPFPAAAAMPTILWLVCVFAKYQTHIWQLWTCWCIFCILTWIGLAPSAAKKCRDIIHSPLHRKNGTNWPHRVHLATSKGWWVHFQGDEQRCIFSWMQMIAFLPFSPSREGGNRSPFIFAWNKFIYKIY